MPELPEVSHFERYFNKTSINKKIVKVSCKDRSMLKGPLSSVITDKKFKRAKRRGKFLIAGVAGSEYHVVFHFGMTGSFYYKKAREKKGAPYAKVTFTFANGDALQWVNKRKFGKIYTVKDVNTIKTLKTMGPDALSISSKEFTSLLHEKSTKNIKAFLMDQSIIAGIGNNYSNEILFRAGIDPHCRVNILSASQRKKLFNTMKSTLRQAKKLSMHGAESEYPRTWLLGHKKDKLCPKNKKHKLKQATIAGRTVLYCPEHQKK